MLNFMGIIWLICFYDFRMFYEEIINDIWCCIVNVWFMYNYVNKYIFDINLVSY